jgi:hypothetical protein
MRPSWNTIGSMAFGVGTAVAVMIVMPPVLWAVGKLHANPFSLLDAWFRYWAQ